MDYISVKEASEKWGVTRRHVQVLCSSGKVVGAAQISGVWLIPTDAEKPPDGRYKANKHGKNANGGKIHGKNK